MTRYRSERRQLRASCYFRLCPGNSFRQLVQCCLTTLQYGDCRVWGEVVHELGGRDLSEILFRHVPGGSLQQDSRCLKGSSSVASLQFYSVAATSFQFVYLYRAPKVGFEVAAPVVMLLSIYCSPLNSQLTFRSDMYLTCRLLHAGLLFSSYFNPEDWGDKFLRNVCSLPTHNIRRYVPRNLSAAPCVELSRKTVPEDDLGRPRCEPVVSRTLSRIDVTWSCSSVRTDELCCAPRMYPPPPRHGRVAMATISAPCCNSFIGPPWMHMQLTDWDRSICITRQPPPPASINCD
jgi:hypothetical protein